MSVDAPGDGAVPPALADLDGDVDFGQPARTLYSTDASIFQIEPAGVVAPADREDVRRVVAFARDRDTSVVARGAGSSLTGNAVGEGIVLDCSKHMDAVREVDAEAGIARVEPGVVLADLNDRLADDGLYFPPDPSTSETCTLGGMVANDAAGPHSVRHGTTRDNVRAVEVVLADGTVAEFRRREGEALERECARDDLAGVVHRRLRSLAREHADEIDASYPDVERNSSGYDLEESAAADGSWVDPSKLVVGSEGTLAVVTEVELDLTERPATRAAALVFYEDVIAAADAVAPALSADPSAVELIDDAVLGYARDAWDVDLVPEAAGAALLLEVETTPDEQAARIEAAVDAARTDATLAAERALAEEEQDRLWTVRKASNPLLNRRPGDEQALSFIEDAAIPPERLPEYLEHVGAILREHDLDASVFGHAGQGVLHVKPFLNLKDEEDRERLRSVSEAVHETVLDLGGCVSGEHGDGMLRSQYLRDMYGEELYGAFVDLKRAVDPDDVFNPGKVVPDSEGDLRTVDGNLRYEGYDPETVETALDFSDEEGFASLIEQCNGCSKCRTEQGGVMCPSYRGEGEEITSTRGRANALRAAIDGELGEDALTSEWFQEAVMDRCLACKACETECPTGVDMAKLKTEVKHRHHQEEGVPLRARLFGNVRTLNRVGSALAPLANRLAEFGPGRRLLEAVAGVDRRRSLPAFSNESFQSWFADHDAHPEAGESGRVALFPDCYMAYNHPEVGRAAVAVLERFGYAVEVPEVACCGRPALSQGLVENARGSAAENADRLGPYAEEGVPVLGVEPSCVSAFEEYDDLLDDPAGVPDAAATVAEFLYREHVVGDAPLPTSDADDAVAFHGHCHSTARGRDHAPVGLLRRAGYEVTPVDATCCGMAGAFGYEAEHYDLSMELGADLARKLAATDADRVAAGGASCTHQLSAQDVDPEHPLVLLAEALC